MKSIKWENVKYKENNIQLKSKSAQRQTLGGAKQRKR